MPSRIVRIKIVKLIKVKYLAIALVIVLLVALGAGCELIPGEVLPAPAPAPTVPPTPINPTWTPPASDNTMPLPGIADVVAKVKPGVVAINVEVVTLSFFNQPITQQGAGSGWIIDSSGIIVTNNHVIEDAQTVTVTLDDGRTFPVDPKSIYTDPLSDLAIIRIDAGNSLPALKVGDSSKLRIGDWVVAIGNSLGQGVRATQGIVASLGVSIPVSQGQTLYNLIDTTAAINPGNSGGPLVNLSGEVIGITSVKIARVGVEATGFAISTQTAVPIIEQLIQSGYVVRPWMGVTLRTVDQFVVITASLKVNKGVLITQVSANSPAARAGLKAGDVIAEVDGKEVTTSPDLVQLIQSYKVGQSVSMSYYRGSNKNTTDLVLAQSPLP
ncbi:MAG: trypsin-like peptidase domain-containing protein [Chloroflexi bacterium]|nr:trypsin-like peptidase domain-containing protein [Chloroflexota bacterium]